MRHIKFVVVVEFIDLKFDSSSVIPANAGTQAVFGPRKHRR